MTDVVIFGAGQIAQVLSAYLEAAPEFNLLGCVVDRAYLPEGRTLGHLPVVAWETLEQDFPPGRVKLLGPISYRDNNKLRRDRYLDAKRRGYDFATYIHPSSHVLGAEIGENSIVLEECTVQPHARLGVGSILWSKVHIGHHTTIGDNCFFASFCGIAGNCTVGSCTFFGGHTGLVDNCSVGADCIIGAGTVLHKPLSDGSVAYAPETRIIENAARRFSRLLLR